MVFLPIDIARLLIFFFKWPKEYRFSFGDQMEKKLPRGIEKLKCLLFKK